MNEVQHVTFFAYAVIGLFPVLGILLDALLLRHRAVLATWLLGFLFLPSVELDLGGVLYWNRNTAPFFVILIGVFFKDGALLRRLRVQWFDLPMIGWCLAPFLASVSNGLGLYDGLSQAFYQTIHWGGPYFIGRLHFQNREHLLDLARAIVLGGMIYLPLCAFEIRFSPVLHYSLYGFNQHAFIQSVRGSFYRPMVFMQHGLMVAMWMAMSTLLSWALVSVRSGVSLFGISARWIMGAMFLVLLAMQSLGALLLAAAAWGIALVCRETRRKSLFLVFALVPTLWSVSRASGLLPSNLIVQMTSPISSERSESLAFRLHAEENLSSHAWRKPLLGWSNRNFDRVDGGADTNKKVVTDGLWIITFSAYGLFGLMSMLLCHLVPVLVVLRRAPPSLWHQQPFFFVAGVMGLVIATVSIDNLFNAMIDPIFVLMMGALPAALLDPQWREIPEEDRAQPPERPQAESTRFRRLLGNPRE